MGKPTSARARYMTAALAVTAGLGIAAAGCGDDDSTTEDSAAEETTTEASAEPVEVTTGEYFFELASTPTAETEEFSVTNEGKEFHVMILAQVNEGFTLEEAIKLEGEKGSATLFAEAELPPGKTVTAKVEEPLESGGEYTMLCPVGGPKGPHYDLGQLEEITVE